MTAGTDNALANGTDVNTVQLPVKDAQGNPLAGFDVVFTITNPDGTTRQQTVTTDANGIAVLPVSSTQAGDVKVEASVGGVTTKSTLHFVADISTATIDQNGLTAGTGNTLANGTDVNTVQLPVKDANGNPIAGYEVVFTVTNPDGSTRQQTVITDANGIATLPVSSDKAGNVKVEANVGGVTSSTDLTFVADSSTANIDQNGLTANAGDTKANGTDVNTVQLPVKDANGNPIAGYEVVFTVTNPDGSTRQQTVTTDANGIATLPVSSDKAGNVKVEANVGGVTSSTELKFVADISTATIDQNGMTAGSGDTPANGSDVNVVQLPVKDANGNPIAGYEVVFTVTNPDGSTRQQTVTTDANGIAALPVSSTQAGNVKVEANVGGVTSSTSLNFVADSSTASIDQNGLTANSGDTKANGTDVNTVQLPVKDANGNPIAGYNVTFTVTEPDGTTRQQTVTTDANGIAALPVSSTQAGNVKVAANVGGVTSSTELKFVADSSTATIDQNGLTANTGDTKANGTDVNTVQLPVKDANGNPIAGYEVVFTVTNPDGTTRQQTVTTDANGIATLPVSSDKAGNVKVEANVGGVTSSTELKFVADSSTATIDQNGLTAATGSTLANGTDVNTVQLPVKDANGNPIAGYDVVFTVTDPDGTPRQQTVTTDANGIATLPVTSDKAGNVKVEANVGGVTSSTDLKFVADSSTATIDQNGLTAGTGNTLANGTDVNTVQLPVKDANGNPIAGYDVVFTVTDPDGTTRQQTVTTDVNGIATLPVTSDKAGNVKVEANVGGVTSSTDLKFVADSSTATIDQNGLTAGTGSTLANGTDVNTVQLPVKDANGNPIAGYDVVFTVTDPDGTTRQQTVTTDVNGIATLPVSSTKSGNVKVEANVGGVTSSTNLSFDADVSTAQINTTNGLVLETAATTIETQVDGDTPTGLSTHNLVITVTDKNGNVITGKAGALAVTFSTTGSAKFVGNSTVSIDENGQAKIGIIDTAQETVTVSAKLNGQSSNSVPASFKNVLKSIVLSKQDITLTKYFSASVTAQAKYSNGSTVDITKTGTWKSSNPKILVDASGNISSTSENETGTISITSDGVSATANVSVIVAKTSAIIGTQTGYTTLISKEKYPTLTFNSGDVIDGIYSGGKLIAGGSGGSASSQVLDLNTVKSITGYSAIVSSVDFVNRLLQQLSWNDGTAHQVGSSTGTQYTATITDEVYGIIVYTSATTGTGYVSGMQIIYN